MNFKGSKLSDPDTLRGRFSNFGPLRSQKATAYPTNKEAILISIIWLGMLVSGFELQLLTLLRLLTREIQTLSKETKNISFFDRLLQYEKNSMSLAPGCTVAQRVEEA